MTRSKLRPPQPTTSISGAEVKVEELSNAKRELEDLLAPYGYYFLEQEEVLFERHPLERTVRWRMVANELSMTLVVRRCFQCSAGKS